MYNSQFSFQLTPSDPTACLAFQVWIDDQCVYHNEHVNESNTVTGLLPSDATRVQHQLKLILLGKTPEHTEINLSGEIVKDATLTVSNLAFDNIELGNLVAELFEYHHDFNGTGSPTVEKFYGTMGCNGSVELKFTTPIYLWLLENM